MYTSTVEDQTIAIGNDNSTSYIQKSSKWKNTSSMKKQFYCHWYFAQFKSKFNLEPSRPSVSWPKMIASGCNP